MEEDRIPREEFEGYFGGKIMVSRPQVQWEEMFKCDARNLLYFRNWRTMAKLTDERKGMTEEIMIRISAEGPQEEEMFGLSVFFTVSFAHHLCYIVFVGGPCTLTMCSATTRH